MTLAIGIMSGTSLDAIDAVLLETSPGSVPVLRDTATHPLPEELQRTILQLMTPGQNEIDLSGQVHIQLGELYAEIAGELIHRAAGKEIRVIGCHGQTVRHRPDHPHPYTLQLGSGAVIATRTGLPTVTDFRSADMAVGGQGAPFAPFFHREIFSSAGSYRAVVNLGGIANITLLPPDDSEQISGFDTGPANCLMDLWIQEHLSRPYDESGDWASKGKPVQVLLERMLADPYFQKPPPKSTGREYFTRQWLKQALADCGLHVEPIHVQSTLAMLVARTICDQIPTEVDEIYLCGGGSRNRHLRELILEISQRPVSDTSVLGFPPQWIEASVFGWMAVATMDRTPNTLPCVTGADQPVIAGAVHYP